MDIQMSYIVAPCLNGMFYLVLYSDYQADIWYYLAHLHTQKIGILVIFLVNFR